MKCSINNKESNYYRTDGKGKGPTIRSIFLADPTFPRRLDAESIRQLLSNSLQPGRTYFEGIAKCEPEPPLESIEDLDNRQGIALLQHPTSDFTLSMLQKGVLKSVPTYCISTMTDLPANRLPNLTIIDTSDTRFITALPDTVSAVEAPIDSLLPVAMMLLARAMKQDGIDQVIAIHPPNLDPALAAAVFSSMGLSAQSLCFNTKQEPEPTIDLSCYYQPELATQLANEFKLPTDRSTPRQQIIWTTLCLLHTQMTGHLLKERKKNNSHIKKQGTRGRVPCVM